MPNGRPGDHPYTDIVVHELDVHTPEIRDHVRRIDEYGESGARHRARSLLWEAWWDPSDEELVQLESDLASLSDAVDRASDYPAESPLEACLDDVDGVYDRQTRELVRDVYDEIHERVDNQGRGRNVFGALLWDVGWKPDDLGAFRARLREFRTDHWIWEK